MIYLQVLAVNPYRGTSKQSVNTDVTSLSMLVKRAGSSATAELPVHNLSTPISIKIPLRTMGANTRGEVRRAFQLIVCTGVACITLDC